MNAPAAPALAPLPDALPLAYRFPSEISAGADGTASVRWRTGQGPFGQTAFATPHPQVASILWQVDVFTPDECARIVELGRARPAQLGTDGQLLEPGRRISWLEPDEQTHWLYHRLGTLFVQANRLYGFDLVGFADPLKSVEEEPGLQEDWHMDLGGDETSLRKLSMAIPLTAPQDYEGGAPEFVGWGPQAQSRTQGSATFWPSFMGTRMTPVTRGSRCALFAWGSGLAFR